MRALRDFLGSPCPVCRKDILQRPPERARMPAADAAWCASCESQLALADLVAMHRRSPAGILSKLFGAKRTRA